MTGPITGRGSAGDAPWSYARPPDLEAFDAMARAAYEALPEDFKRLCGNVVVHTAEEAEPDILASFGIADPLELSGLYEGVDLIQTGVSDPVTLPNHVHLYRRAIIAEWRERRDVTLSFLIKHVLVHEIGHHFGLSDADMHAIEDAAE